jgi:hypothetical protein
LFLVSNFSILLDALLAVSQIAWTTRPLIELGLKLDGPALRAAFIALQDPLLAGE